MALPGQKIKTNAIFMQNCLLHLKKHNLVVTVKNVLEYSL